MNLQLNNPRAFIVSDTHFGARNNSIKWLNLMSSYFEDFLIPLLEKEYREGDILIHCGDVFDNRQSLNILVMHKTMSIFEKLSSIFKNGIYIIAGNHDIHKKNTNEITSLDTLKYIPGINIIKEPEILQVNSHKLLLMPWRVSHKEETDCVLMHPESDYVFMHGNITSMNFNKYVEVEEGADISAFKNMKRVYSGHIHWAQYKKNIRMVGNPYQMTRSDATNTKGIWRLDLDTDVEQFYENTYSPKFVKIYLDKCLEMTLQDIETICKNNFVDLYISSEFLLKYQISDLISFISKSSSELDVITYDEDTSNVNVEYDDSFDIFTLCRSYVNEINYESETKDRIISKLSGLYKNTLKENI